MIFFPCIVAKFLHLLPALLTPSPLASELARARETCFQLAMSRYSSYHSAWSPPWLLCERTEHSWYLQYFPLLFNPVRYWALSMVYKDIMGFQSGL